jgi:hypothetical protein
MSTIKRRGKIEVNFSPLYFSFQLKRPLTAAVCQK